MFESRQRSARDGALAIAGYSGLVWVVGKDAVTFLDSLLSQNVAAMEPGTTAQSLLLGPNGKLRATLHLLRGDEKVGLACDATVVDTVAADLARFKIRVDAEIEIEQETVWDVWGQPDSTSEVPLPSGTWSESDRVVRAKLPFRFSDVQRSLQVGQQPSAEPVQLETIEAFRIEIGQAQDGVDLDEKTIPQEGVDVAATVDFSKGCFLGQELVARIDSRGHVNRRLCGLVFETGETPPRGSEVLHATKTVGSITSAAVSPGRGVGIGLAMVRVEVAEFAVVTVAGLDAKVVKLPIFA